MFTNNWINLTKKIFLGEASTNINAKDTAGQTKTFYGDSRGFQYCLAIGKFLSNPLTWGSIPATSSSTATTYAGVYFGAGATPAAKTDYTLEQMYPKETFSVSCLASGIMEQTPGQYTYAVDYVLRNNSNETITINEVGLALPCPTSNSTSSVYYQVCLMERTVLDEPVTIPVGESRLITYKLVFKQS